MKLLYLGELAAIITSITYAVNSTLFTVAGRVVGSTVVNRVRLIAACFFNPRALDFLRQLLASRS